jgi:hypothetical protein
MAIVHKEFQPFEDRVNFTFLNDLSLDGILARTQLAAGLGSIVLGAL